VTEWLEGVLKVRLDNEGRIRTVNKSHSWYARYRTTLRAAGSPWGGRGRFLDPEIASFEDLAGQTSGYFRLPTKRVAYLWLGYTETGLW